MDDYTRDMQCHAFAHRIMAWNETRYRIGFRMVSRQTAVKTLRMTDDARWPDGWRWIEGATMMNPQHIPTPDSLNYSGLM